MGWYKHWFGTPWYALLYGHRDEAEARTWVDALLDRWALPKGSQVLDMACGRGRHSRWFHAAGMKVTGIDISDESIKAAKELVPEARFHVHDMREPFAHAEFDAACSLFTSLGYFDDKDDRKVFSAAWDALRPGGRFVVDFMNSPLVISQLVPEERIVKSGVEFHISRSVENGHIVKRITVRTGGDDQVFEEKVRAIMPGELTDLAHGAGFGSIEVTDGPQPLPFDPATSSRFVMWMTKPMK